MPPKDVDDSLWLEQDESCGHILYTTPPGQEQRYMYDLEGSPSFPDQEQAFEWHADNCPILRKKGIRPVRET